MKALLLLYLLSTSFQVAPLKTLAALGVAAPAEFNLLCEKERLETLSKWLNDAIPLPDAWPSDVSKFDVSNGLVRLADRVGSATQQVRSRLILADTLLESQRNTEALVVVQEAHRLAEPPMLAETESKLGVVLVRLEEFDEAETYLKRAERGLQAPGSAPVLARTWMYLGGCLSRLNRTADAIGYFEKAGSSGDLSSRERITSYRAIRIISRDPRQRGKAAQQVALIQESDLAWDEASKSWLNASFDFGERYYDAWFALENAKRCWRRTGNKELEAAWGINASSVLIDIGRPQDARAVLMVALKYYRDVLDVGAQASCYLNLADAYSELGSMPNAKQFTTSAAESYRKAGLEENAVLADIALSNLLIDEGNPSIAARVARQAGLNSAPNSVSQGYALAAEAHAALLTSEKAVALSKAQLASKIFARIGEPSGKLFCHQLTGRALAASNSWSLAAQEYEAGLKVVEEWRKELAQPELSIAAGVGLDLLPGRGAEALVKLGRESEAFNFLQRAKGGTMNLPPTPLTTLRATIASDEAIIDYALSDSSVIAFAVTKSGSSVSSTPVDPTELPRQIQDFNVLIKKEVQASKGVLSRALFQKLIAPSMPSIKGKTKLILCPDGILHDVPFAALADSRGKPMIEHFAIATAPSASGWCASLRRSMALIKESGGPAIVVGISRFKAVASDKSARSGLSALPSAPAEVTLIKQTFGPTTRTLSESNATAASFLRAAPTAGYLHVATHAISNRLDPLQTALVMSPGSHTDPGMVYPTDLLSSKLNCRLAVLSACGTYRGRLVRGEGPKNFAWAFVAAGCPSVVSTLWKIDDRAALAWAKAFYASYKRTTNPGISLQKACLTLRATKEFSSPVHWAAWTLTGSNR